MAKIPDFWNRDVLFFANLMSLFFGNELELEELENLVGEIDSYGGRLVPVINTIFKGENNVLVLERAPDKSLCQYFTSHLGLSLPRIEVLSHQDYLANAQSAFNWAKKRISHDKYWLDGYVTDDALSTWAANPSKPTISSTSGSHRGNNKRLLHEFLMASDLPLPITRLASDDSQVRNRLLELKGMGFNKAAVRSAVGASGIGTIKADLGDEDAIPSTPDFFFREGPCLVQGWIEVGINKVIDVKSPSVQLFLDDSSVHLYDITDQILSKDSVHEGNVSPPPYLDEDLKTELLRQADLVGGWLHSQGYRGTGSIDYIVARQSDMNATIVYTSEINARITGATYPSVLARRFIPSGAWLMETSASSHHGLANGSCNIYKLPQNCIRQAKTKGCCPLISISTRLIRLRNCRCSFLPPMWIIAWLWSESWRAMRRWALRPSETSRSEKPNLS